MQGFLARYSAMRDCASRSKDYTCGPAHAKNKRKPPQRMGRHTRCRFLLKIDAEPYLLGRNGGLEKLKTENGGPPNPKKKNENGGLGLKIN